MSFIEPCPCVKVRKEHGEEVRLALKAANLLRTDLRIQHDDEFVYLPLTAEQVLEAAELNVEIELCNREFEALDKSSIVELTGLKPSYEIVGDIAVLTTELPDAEAVASAILKLHRNIKVVARRKSHVEGVFRRRKIEIIAGEQRTETMHKENGCRYKLDLERVYFNPRLATERARVASLVAPGEVVIDMFAGVGPFSILIARRVPESRVIAIDINPDAIRYLRENIRLNGVTNVTPVEGDVRMLHSEFMDTADRIIMNLPGNAHEYLPEAIGMLKPEGGTIHFYTVESMNRGEASSALLDKAKQKFMMYLRDASAEILAARKVKAYAPYAYIAGIDAKVYKQVHGGGRRNVR